MGFSQLDLTPIAGNGPTATTPPGKAHLAKIFQVSRTDTGSVNKVVLPAQSSVIAIRMYGSVNSNAGTTAQVVVNVNDNTGIISNSVTNVLTGGATTQIVQASGLPNIAALPANGDLVISVAYQETGTASTTGGPWKFVIEYVA